MCLIVLSTDLYLSMCPVSLSLHDLVCLCKVFPLSLQLPQPLPLLPLLPFLRAEVVSNCALLLTGLVELTSFTIT